MKTEQAYPIIDSFLDSFMLVSVREKLFYEKLYYFLVVWSFRQSCIAFSLEILHTTI